MKTPGVAYLNARLGVFGGVSPLCGQGVQIPTRALCVHRANTELAENAPCHRLIIMTVGAGADTTVVLCKDTGDARNLSVD